MVANLSAAVENPEAAARGHNLPALLIGVLLIVVIICGNLLVCLSVFTEKALKTTTNYFIVSLAVADLMLAVLVLPLFVYSEVRLIETHNRDSALYLHYRWDTSYFKCLPHSCIHSSRSPPSYFRAPWEPVEVYIWSLQSPNAALWRLCTPGLMASNIFLSNLLCKADLFFEILLNL